MEAFICKIIKLYSKRDLRLHASSSAFYIVVSALPLMSVLIYALSFSSVLIAELEGLLKAILPRDFYSSITTVIEGIKERGLPSLVPFSIILALWSSTKGIGGLCYGIESIYGTKKGRGFVARALRTAWRTLLFYLIIIASLLVFALSKLISSKGLLISTVLSLRIIIFAAILSLIFSFFYSRLASTPFKNHILGGTFASIGWMLFTYVYSLYVRHSLGSASIYAEMGTAIFFILWIYFCVNIILLGALINNICKKAKP